MFLKIIIKLSEFVENVITLLYYLHKAIAILTLLIFELYYIYKNKIINFIFFANVLIVS